MEYSVPWRRAEQDGGMSQESNSSDKITKTLGKCPACPRNSAVFTSDLSSMSQTWPLLVSPHTISMQSKEDVGLSGFEVTTERQHVSSMLPSV